MKVLIISDIHGSGYYAEKIKEIEEKKTRRNNNIRRLILPWAKKRTKPRIRTNESSKILNSMKEKLTVIRGNCDAEVDEMISEFQFHDYVLKEINGKNLLPHGLNTT